MAAFIRFREEACLAAYASAPLAPPLARFTLKLLFLARLFELLFWILIKEPLRTEACSPRLFARVLFWP